MAVDEFLKIDGIPGDSSSIQHLNEIVIDSYSWLETQAGGGTTAKIAMNDISFTAKLSKASPLLMQACATGQVIASAELTLVKAGSSPLQFEKWTFTNVIVSSYKFGYSGGGILPVDQFTLSFEQIRFEYTPSSPAGGADLANRETVTWNRRTNTV